MGNCQKAFDKIKQYLQNPSTFGKERQPIYLLYLTLQQKRLLTESHPSLPSFSSQDNEVSVAFK